MDQVSPSLPDDLATLEADIAAAVAGAGDEAALEAVRVAALGKKG
ncbi:MAG: phenylalanine--tRNA ligase subunit alpha, partial [Pseudomonadota bacterium]